MTAILRMFSPLPRSGGEGRTVKRVAAWCVLSGLILTCASPARAEDQRVATVGMAGRIDQLVLPGGELEVRPIDERRPRVVLRIVAVYPHGTAHRYDLVYYGLEPGTFDLRSYLRRKDGSAATDLPPVPVTIRSVLPAGQIEPHRLEMEAGPFLGGYRLALGVGAALWIVGLLLILLLRRRRPEHERKVMRAPLTLAEQLRPLVEEAMAGRLAQPERARLERMLLAYWRRRLGLGEMRAAEAFAVLREHEEAGPLLQHLERWLHRPGNAEPADLGALLRPYQELPPEVAVP